MIADAVTIAAPPAPPLKSPPEPPPSDTPDSLRTAPCTTHGCYASAGPGWPRHRRRRPTRPTTISPPPSRGHGTGRAECVFATRPPTSRGRSQSMGPMAERRSTDGVIHGKESAKFNWDSAICHSLPFDDISLHRIGIAQKLV